MSEIVLVFIARGRGISVWERLGHGPGTGEPSGMVRGRALLGLVVHCTVSPLIVTLVGRSESNSVVLVVTLNRHH